MLLVHVDNDMLVSFGCSDEEISRGIERLECRFRLFQVGKLVLGTGRELPLQPGGGPSLARLVFGLIGPDLKPSGGQKVGDDPDSDDLVTPPSRLDGLAHEWSVEAKIPDAEGMDVLLHTLGGCRSHRRQVRVGTQLGPGQLDSLRRLLGPP